MTAPHLEQGRRGERLACRFLLDRGFDVLVFVEIKTRATRDFGSPWEFVDWQKQRRIIATAQEFIARYDLGRCAYRFDIVSVLAPGSREEEVVLYRNAF